MGAEAEGTFRRGQPVERFFRAFVLVAKIQKSNIKSDRNRTMWLVDSGVMEWGVMCDLCCWLLLLRQWGCLRVELVFSF